ncbi:MAG: hypothetical protein KC418_19945 [Anaerolineales bacterium]|nr:hypothetical protein [Anaerolineales bacterium]MCB8952743.1 hypothetical protein [Ardenticatenales bacterium]
MITLQIQGRALEKEVNELLQQEFGGDAEKMLHELIKLYASQFDRLKYSGILKWEQDGLAFQKESRRAWR